MRYDYPVCRFIAVYEDHWEIREGTELDMNEIVDEFCDDGLVSEKGTTVPGVQMLYQDGIIDRDESNPEAFKAFVNPFSAQFSGYGKAIHMNFVLVGFDDYTDEEEAALRKMSKQEILQYVRKHPLDYRSLSDEEIAQCTQLLEGVFAQGKKVFLGGSQTYAFLPDEGKARLDAWMSNNALFLVGDCEGADQLMQLYLHEKGYRNVFVYVSGDEIRHNEGGWEVVHCHAAAAPHSYEFYKVKDTAMADLADTALMLWDGESPGTRENIIEMRQKGKTVTILRTHGAWCWEEYCGDSRSRISDENLRKELRRYESAENVSIAAAVKRCPRAEKELHLKRDEVFLLRQALLDGQPDPAAAAYTPFLSFTDVLASVRDELVQQDPALPKPYYRLEKWASKGDFNLTFFRFRDELIELEPPDEDFHMEQTAVFYLDGDEVMGFHLTGAKNPRKKARNSKP